MQDLRYGENSHQQVALYRDLYPAPGSLVTGVQLQGKDFPTTTSPTPMRRGSASKL